jgi:hypothetical protein
MTWRKLLSAAKPLPLLQRTPFAGPPQARASERFGQVTSKKLVTPRRSQVRTHWVSPRGATR